jgi:hypothetical protein
MTKQYVHLVIEKTEASTEVCGVYASVDKAIQHAEDLADYADLIPINDSDNIYIGNYNYCWVTESGELPLVYIETQELIQ